MEFITSDQAYEEYQRLRTQEKTTNEGVNLLNYSEKCKPKSYYIQVMKITKTKINKAVTTINVESDLPFVSICYYDRTEYDCEKFLKQLKRFVSIPRYNSNVVFNKNNKTSSYNIGIRLREETIDFDSVVIDIGKNAEKFFEDNEIHFVDEVKELLSQQRNATEQEIKDFDRVTYLVEEVDNIERLIKKTNYYSYENEKDDSLKITISLEEYNKRLKIIEDELNNLKLKYDFISLPRFSYEDTEIQEDDEEEYDDGEDGYY